MIYIHKQLKSVFPADPYPYEEQLKEVSENIRKWLEESGSPAEKTGLYLATSNAGVAESIAFWKNALEHSPRFTNPANFNWTLSNGPASLLSRLLKIKGPCHTLIGKSGALTGCFFHASDDLEAGIVSTALIAGLDIHEKEVTFNICLVSKSDSNQPIEWNDVRKWERDDEKATSFLSRIFGTNTLA